MSWRPVMQNSAIAARITTWSKPWLSTWPMSSPSWCRRWSVWAAPLQGYTKSYACALSSRNRRNRHESETARGPGLQTVTETREWNYRSPLGVIGFDAGRLCFDCGDLRVAYGRY